MRIHTLTLIASMTVMFGCPSDDSGDEGGSTGDTVSTTATTTMSTTDSTTASTTASTTDATTTDATTTDATTTDATTTTDPTVADSSSGGGSGSDTGASADCMQYCTDFLATCNDGTGGADPYDDEAACLDACGMFTVDDGTPMGGDDLECRLYHLSVAMMKGQAETHCPHADVDGSGVCS